MSYLVAHLKSKKHGMDNKEAMYLARKHNLPKSKNNGTTAQLETSAGRPGTKLSESFEG